MIDGRTVLGWRWLLLTLLVVGAALFGVGVAAERNSTHEHHTTETANHSETTLPTSSAPTVSSHGDGDAGETAPTTAHDADGGAGEQTETGTTTVEAVHNEATETGAGETGAGESSEKVLGLNLESTPLVIIAILASIALGIATVVKPARPLLIVTAAFSIGFAVFDIAHQFNASKPGIAVLAIAIAAIHAAAAIVAIQWTARPLTTRPTTRTSSDPSST